MENGEHSYIILTPNFAITEPAEVSLFVSLGKQLKEWNKRLIWSIRVSFGSI